jgi:hypothetical protein
MGAKKMRFRNMLLWLTAILTIFSVAPINAVVWDHVTHWYTLPPGQRNLTYKVVYNATPLDENLAGINIT